MWDPLFPERVLAGLIFPRSFSSAVGGQMGLLGSMLRHWNPLLCVALFPLEDKRVFVKFLECPQSAFCFLLMASVLPTLGGTEGTLRGAGVRHRTVPPFWPPPSHTCLSFALKLDELTQDLSMSQLSDVADYLEDVA